MIKNKHIFIYGGSGSLGLCLIDRYIDNNYIINFSRDECKHWSMELKYKDKNLKNIIGNINDYNRVENSLLRENPNIIIIAAAMKHIDKCEYASSESLNTNLLGIQNILESIEKNQHYLTNLETIVFVSTDKACSPINIYGICKALSEKLVIEKSYYLPKFKFVCTRYGNVLNSRGSIIPILHEIGKNEDKYEFCLTHEKMTRFIMTLEESVDLIEYAILDGENGDIIIPKLRAMYVKDLFQIFGDLYNKPIKLIGLRVGEKMSESLINETQSARTNENAKYYHIKSNYNNKILNNNFYEYNSNQNLMNIEDLNKYLKLKKLI